MFPAFLITLREVIEISLIVATILGILVKYKQKKGVHTVWSATAFAIGTSILLLFLGSIFGLRMQEVYSGKIEEFIEGTLLITSSLFITWAVFFLHKHFAGHKVRLLQKIRKTIDQEEQKGLFGLVYFSVLREGFEIVLFLSTIYFSSNPQSIFVGFLGGSLVGIALSFLLFTATLKLPVFYAFRLTSVLLILFAGGMLARGIGELSEFGIIPEFAKFTFPLVPSATTFSGDIIQTVFGISKMMDVTQFSLYASYVLFMTWWVFLRKTAL